MRLSTPTVPLCRPCAARIPHAQPPCACTSYDAIRHVSSLLRSASSFWLPLAARHSPQPPPPARPGRQASPRVPQDDDLHKAVGVASGGWVGRRSEKRPLQRQPAATQRRCAAQPRPRCQYLQQRPFPRRHGCRATPGVGCRKGRRQEGGCLGVTTRPCALAARRGGQWRGQRAAALLQPHATIPRLWSARETTGGGAFEDTGSPPSAPPDDGAGHQPRCAGTAALTPRFKGGLLGALECVRRVNQAGGDGRDTRALPSHAIRHVLCCRGAYRLRQGCAHSSELLQASSARSPCCVWEACCEEPPITQASRLLHCA